MTDRRRSEAPLPLSDSARPEHRATNEIMRAIFSAMIDQGITQAEFAERVGITERTLEKWRSPTLFHERAEGPGLILIMRSLIALGLNLDVVRNDDHSRKDQKRFSLALKNDMARIRRDMSRRGETLEERQDRVERVKNDALKKGLLDE